MAASSDSIVAKRVENPVAQMPAAKPALAQEIKKELSPVTLTGAVTLPVIHQRNSPFKLTVNSPILPKPTGDGTIRLMATPVLLRTATQLVTTAGSPQTPVQVVTALAASSGVWNRSGSVGKRKMATDAGGDDMSAVKRQRRNSTEKGNKGLRHFSMKVCEKVQQKGVTSYNEVADELVKEFADPMKASPDQSGDQKNIRRRVYDALNVLMAMNIISKEKKEIKWIGLPTNSAQECVDLEQKKRTCDDRIKQKNRQLEDLILQQVAFMNLVKRNKEREQTQGLPSRNTSIQLPFIVVNTGKKTVIDCKISNDKSEYTFDFDNAFEIHDDIEVLKRMGMAFGLEKGGATPEQLSLAQNMLPKQMHPFLSKMAVNGSLSPVVSRNSAAQLSPLAQPLSGTPMSPQVTMSSLHQSAVLFSPLKQASPHTNSSAVSLSPSPVALSSPVVVSTPMATHTYALPMPTVTVNSPAKKSRMENQEIIDVVGGETSLVENGSR
eukprot:m.308930 g.308930  ORF g.308930 m.308930 type:complete len:494 (+) comp45082_c0_seq1:300-1781(+)